MPRPGTGRPRIHQAVLQLPRVDWVRLKHGIKREVRVLHLPVAFNTMPPPIPFVGWSSPAFAVTKDDSEHFMFIADARWKEPLKAISPDSLEAEGFADLKEFRRYWRTHRADRIGFRGDRVVHVLKLRPFTEDDLPAVGRRLFDHMYGEYLP